MNNEALTKICPACGSNNIEEFRETKQIKVPYGSEEKVELTFHKCLDCETEGDFEEKNDELILQNEKKSVQSSIKPMFDFFSQSGLSLAYIERALELPQRTMMRWKSGEVSASSIALLRILRTYPWIIEVAESQFDPFIANAIHITNAATNFFQLAKTTANVNRSEMKFDSLGIFSKSLHTFIYAKFSHNEEPFLKLPASDNIEIASGQNSLNIPLEVRG
jgi:hypothetical protein